MDLSTHATANACLKIDLDGLTANYRSMQKASGRAKVAAVVKADAYGLGAIPIVGALADAGCRHFFVAQLSEAIALAPAKPSDASIYVLNGLHPGSEAACAMIGALPVLNSLDQIRRWSCLALSQKRSLPAALQVDTGMSRLGLPAREVDTVIAEPARLEGIDLRLVMSHLACADQPDDPANAMQDAIFRSIATHFPGVPRSLDNSGGALQNRGHPFDIVRAGIALFGGTPHADAPNPMRPVVSLQTWIVQVRDVPDGTGVGYGLSFHVDGPARIATIAVGYADGWPRHLSNRGAAYIGGIRAPIAGRVSMDSITLDVTGVPDHLLFAGAPVELLGPNQTIDDVAADADTISYEILTQLGHRYAREYLPERAAGIQRSACA